MSNVEFESVTKRFGDEVALSSFSLSIAHGSLVTLLGPSGCGKTTALRLLAGFEALDSGAILVDGTDISNVPAAKRGFGMVFQAYSLFPNLTAEENVRFPMDLRRIGKTQIASRLDQLFETIGMSNQRKKYPHQLSGGQQQRVALARALAAEPRLLLLDEPLSALDAAVREQLRDEIRNLQVQSGVTTIFVTHDQQEALAISDSVVVMRKGTIEQIGSPVEIYSQPNSEFVARFVGTTNEIELSSSGSGSWEWANTSFTGPKTSLGTLFLRPEQIELISGSQYRVAEISFHGSFTRLRVESKEQSLLVELDSASARAFKVGDLCDARPKSDSGLIISR